MVILLLHGRTRRGQSVLQKTAVSLGHTGSFADIADHSLHQLQLDTELHHLAVGMTVSMRGIIRAGGAMIIPTSLPALSFPKD